MNRSTVISYGKGRDGISWRARVVIIVVCASPLVVYVGGPPLVHAVRTRYWLSRIKNYSRPASEIVYTDDPAECIRLGTMPGYMSGSLDGRPVTYREPQEWHHLSNPERDTYGVVTHGIVLLHQVPNQDRLIYCCLSGWPVARSDSQQRSLVLAGLTLGYGDVCDEEGPWFGEWPFCADQMLKIILQPADNVTIFAAQPSADGKSFWFDVLINRNRYTIDVSEDTSGLVRLVRYRARQGRLMPFKPNDYNSTNELYPNG